VEEYNMPESLWPPLTIREKKKIKCMFGKDEEPAKEPYTFDGWTFVSGNSGTTTFADTYTWADDD
jgi:hypothetical protein